MPQLNETELAARYGFAMAVLNSSPELKRLFHKAVQGTWTPERFQAAVRNSQWFKKHGEAWRNASIQKASDPATYKANVAQVRTRLGMMASEFGAVVTATQLAQMAESAYMFGWDDNQIRQSLATYVRFTDGRMIGQAGQWEQDLRAHAAAQGVTISNSWLSSQVRGAIGGKWSVEDVQRKVDDYAISAFPHLADRIREGETLADIADPYRQTMAALLEVNPESLTLKDPTLKQALQSKDAKGQPVLRTLYDFENDLRADKRWLKTKNAQDAGMSTVNRVLKDMGVLS